MMPGKILTICREADLGIHDQCFWLAVCNEVKPHGFDAFVVFKTKIWQFSVLPYFCATIMKQLVHTHHAHTPF